MTRRRNAPELLAPASRTRRLYRLKNLAAEREGRDVYIQHLGRTCFPKGEAEAMLEDLANRGYELQLEEWAPRAP
jgi:hypothetical protein